jgi:hypothetical protein
MKAELAGIRQEQLKLQRGMWWPPFALPVYVTNNEPLKVSVER